MAKKVIALAWVFVMALGAESAECDWEGVYKFKDKNGKEHKVTRERREFFHSTWNEKKTHEWHLFEEQKPGGTVTIIDENGEKKTENTMAISYIPVRVPFFFPGCRDNTRSNEIFPNCYTSTFWYWTRPNRHPEFIKIPEAHIDLSTNMSQTFFEETLAKNFKEFSKENTAS